MDTTRKIRIFTSADCRQNRTIIQHAVSGLEKTGYGTTISLEEVTSGNSLEPLLVIDGNNKMKGWKALNAIGIKPDFHLIVTDLGIETGSAHYHDDDLQLLIDGVQAECTVPEDPAPKFNCPCCG